MELFVISATRSKSGCVYRDYNVHVILYPSTEAH